MISIARIRTLLVVSTIGLMVACSPTSSSFKATNISGVDWGGAFTLTSHTGKPVNLSDFQGKLTVLFFGYTHCPDVCAPTLVKLAQAMKQLGEESKAVQVLFITVDPAHDTTKQLAGFVPRFHPSFIGLTGSAAEIAKVAGAYKVGFAAKPASGAEPIRVDHATSLFVTDRQGKLRLLAKNEIPATDLVHDLKMLLNEKTGAK